MPKVWISTASILAMVAVGAGALGAHALKKRLEPELLSSFEVAVRYQMYHALAILAAAWVMSLRPSSSVTAAAWCFLIGILLFSGSIYGLTLLKWRWLGPVTPLGGVSLMAGWVMLAIAAWR